MLQPKKATDDDYDDNNGDSGSGSRNTWAAIGIPGNWEAGGTHLGRHSSGGLHSGGLHSGGLLWGSTVWLSPLLSS